MLKINFRDIVLTIGMLSLLACDNKSGDQAEGTESPTEIPSTETTEAVENKDSESPATFDISSIPTTDKDLGTFPYFSAPKKTRYINKGGKLLDYDQSFIAINGTFIPVEGPSFRAYIHKEKGEEWSPFYVEKSYEDMITKLGGVKISDGSVSREEVDRIGTDKLKSGGEGSLDYWNSDPIKTWVIRKEGGPDVFVQLQVNSASGSIQIAQGGEFEQTITLIQAEEIKQQLDESGKAVLYINFDTDKASLKPDGKEIVAEISKVLNQDKNLKLSIEGHTDNTGNGGRNLTLSKDRANTVAEALRQAGIAKERLQTNGFGSEKPLVDNNSEENKALNRRVELVKI